MIETKLRIKMKPWTAVQFKLVGSRQHGVAARSRTVKDNQCEVSCLPRNPNPESSPSASSSQMTSRWLIILPLAATPG